MIHTKQLYYSQSYSILFRTLITRIRWMGQLNEYYYECERNAWNEHVEP